MHVPVLLHEMLEALNPSPGKRYLDATFGGGGYTRAILNSAPCFVVGTDRDVDAKKRACDMDPASFQFQLSTFSELCSHFEKSPPFDGMVFDFGVSSFQLDEAHRGFSFRLDGPLDMRMSPEGETAQDIIHKLSEKELADVIYTYGDETRSRKIAAAIVQARRKKRIETTLELAEIIRPHGTRKPGIDAATLTFQALRIYVNNELIEIEGALRSAGHLLAEEGRLVCVTFHALEDRLVKNFARTFQVSRGNKLFYLQPIYKKAMAPSSEEVRSNPRSRSAKLRAYTLKEASS